MNFTILESRLNKQLLAGSDLSDPKNVVSSMCAMQAQDFNAAKWAIGIRLKGTTEKSITESFNKGEIVRTHLMRPTWHIVSADDIYWLLDLTVPHIKSIVKRRHINLGLTTSILNKSLNSIEKVLTGGFHLTREEIVAGLAKVKIITDGVHASHILLHAELEGLICSGPVKNKKLSYGLLEERVPIKNKLNREESIAKLALKYFSSRGPALVEDFTWWSGLSLKDARLALELNKNNLATETLDSKTFWFNNSSPLTKTKKPLAHLLPAYDEFLISYRDRSSCIPPGIERTIISNNGIFRPVVLINGKVAGLWTRKIAKSKTLLEVNLFQPAGHKTITLLNHASNAYSLYLNHPAEIVYK